MTPLVVSLCCTAYVAAGFATVYLMGWYGVFRDFDTLTFLALWPAVLLALLAVVYLWPVCLALVGVHAAVQKVRRW